LLTTGSLWLEMTFYHLQRRSVSCDYTKRTWETLIWYLYMCSRQESDHELAEREPLRQDHCLYSVSANVSRLPHFLFDKNANRH